VLRLEGVKAWYGLTQALFDVSLDLREGETLALVGANGGGKTTIMRSILGLVRTEGEVLIDGRPVTRVPTARRVRDFGIGAVHEGRGLFTAMTVRENLVVGLRRGEGGELPDVIELFPPLRGRLDERVSNLSGGEQQMVALGRAILRRPRLLLLDEPSLGLAPIVVGQIYEFLSELRGSELAILLAEQSTVRASEFADRVCEVRTGVAVGAGEAEPRRSG
jgi:branched-chain amino acid transport system ATP-binding protein